MKKILFLLSLVIFSVSANAEQIFEMKNGSPYIYFSNFKIKSIKSDNPSIISAQKVSTFSSSSNQAIFYPKRLGSANIKIDTDNGERVYKILIKNSVVKSNNIFMEIDTPEMVKK